MEEQFLKTSGQFCSPNGLFDKQRIGRSPQITMFNLRNVGKSSKIAQFKTEIVISQGR